MRLVPALVVLVVLAVAAPAAQAFNTWYIDPFIYNQTGSTAQNCPDSASDLGCVYLNASAVNDGNFVSDPKGGPPGGQQWLPANVNYLDEPDFIAPHDFEGADGYFAYTMPDGTGYGLLAEDDLNGLGEFAQAYAGCAMVSPGAATQYSCIAGEPNTNGFGDPSSENYQPAYSFHPISGTPLFTAAGEVCSMGPGPNSNATYCTSGRDCSLTNTTDCSQQTGNGGWTNTDTDNYMSLEVRLNSEDPGAGPVYVTDLAAINTGEFSNSYSQCTLSGVEDTCWLNTSGGCANTGTNSAPLPGGCGQDALQISYGPYSGTYWNQGASVQVVSELEIPSDMAEDWQEDFWEAEAEALAEAVGMWDGGGDEARGRAPAPRALRAHVSRSGGVQVAYRAAKAGQTLVTLARESATGRGPAAWTRLGGLRVLGRTDHYFSPRNGRKCPAEARSGPAGGGRCHVDAKRWGHARHEDRPGLNDWHVRRSLAPGRYRLTARSYHGIRTSRAVHTDFTVGG